MKKILLAVTLMSVLALSVNAGTVAYWRFEEGTDGADVDRGGLDNGVYYPACLDNSGYGNELSTWSTGWAGYQYTSNVGLSEVGGAANNLSVRNSGSYPAMWTSSDDAISSMTFSSFTIEAMFKLEDGGYRTIVGRDSQGTATTNGSLAALYFQAMPDNALAIKYCDVEGYWHEAISATNVFDSYTYSEDPDGDTAPWYSMAAVCDGSTLSLYLDEIGDGLDWELIAQTDLTLSGSTDTTLTAGAGDGGDWDAGNWSVGRGLYAGGHGDRAWGYIDEVRISDSALTVDQFLVPEPATLALLGLGALTGLRRRK